MDWGLVGIAFVFSLALGHHPSLLALGLPLGAAVLLRRPGLWREGRTLGAAAGAFLLAQIPLLYLPLRDQPGTLFAPGTLRSPAGLWAWVSAAGFRGDMLYFSDARSFGDRAQVLGNILWLQMGPLLLAAALAGGLRLVRRDPPAALLLCGSAALTALAALSYRAPQTVEYLMPLYVALALLVAAAAGALAAWRRPAGVLLVALGLAGLVLARRDLPGTVHEAHTSMRRASATTLDCAPPGATILASWHDAMPLTYLERHPGEAARGDSAPAAGDPGGGGDAGDGGDSAGGGDRGPAADPVPGAAPRVVYVYPEGAEPIGATWRRRLAEAGPPAILTNRSRELLEAGTPLWPLPFTAFYAAQPPAACPEGRAGLQADRRFGDRVRLRSVRAEWDLAAPADRAGGLPLLLDLEALGPITETLTVVAQLVDPADGRIAAQADLPVSPERWAAPGGVGLRADLTPFRGPLPPDLRLSLGLYRQGAAGPERLGLDGGAEVAADLGPLPGAEALPALALPEVEPGEIPFGRAMTLLGSQVQREGAELRVDLRWRAEPWAARSDYTVSVQAQGEGWQAQDDGTPALGAFPTLKWLPGMVIHDRHRIALPLDLPPDAPYRVTVGVYDAFSLAPLPVTDAERVRQGQGQAAEIARSP